MKRLLPFLVFTAAFLLRAATASAQDKSEAQSPTDVPPALQEWIPWVQHDLPEDRVVPLYNQHESRIAVWPARLQLNCKKDSATFSLEAEVFEKSWVSLPGQSGIWPAQVTVNGKPTPILERNKRPAIWLEPGRHSIAGTFQWENLPQQLKLPPEIGLLDLTILDKKQETPSWEPDGTLWLQRQATQEVQDQDYLSLEAYSLLSDGIPLWFETRLELIVAGKNREEIFGRIIPKGWQLASLDSPLPTAIDQAGILKAQVRPGKWVIRLRSFRSTPTSEIAFPAESPLATSEQVLAFQSSPRFRQAEIIGLPQIDASQTQTPNDWKSLPLYRWNTHASFQLVERIRGAGQQGATPIRIQRSLWLDEDGSGLTFRDNLNAEAIHEIRRLDIAEGHQLGSVTISNEPQLITADPANGLPGFEIRGTSLSATATGRVPLDKELSATGWQTTAESLQATLHLPPGYRLFAMLGVDHSNGDWLRSWSLLDLFLLFLFTFAIHRICGFPAGVLAFITFAIAYHEPGSPRLSWLVLLIPVAIANALSPSRAQSRAVFFKWLAFAYLLLFLGPFIAQQIQGVVYPQLERVHRYSFADNIGMSTSYSPSLSEELPAAGEFERNARSVIKKESAGLDANASWGGKPKSRSSYSYNNLKADPKAVIQTGPGVPEWQWRTVSYSLAGPISETQKIHHILISPPLSRALGALRVLCISALAIWVVSGRKKKTKSTPPPMTSPSKLTASIPLLLGAFFLLISPENARAQFPDQTLLDELKNRVTQSTEAFPGAADIASASLHLQGESISLSMVYHAAARCAAPVPASLAAWGLQDVKLGDTPATLLRHEGGLWILLPEAGIHTLTLTAHLRTTSEWEWSFPIRPRRVSVEAEGWTLAGLRPDGQAEGQILFHRDTPGDATSATYDRPDTRPALVVERQIELGLLWRVTTTVRRISPTGRTVSIHVPLLSGERVTTQALTTKNGNMEVHLAPNATQMTWESELAITNQLTLITRESDSWVEQWRIMVSPVWNVHFSGLQPTFEATPGEQQLAAFWTPWPSENTTVTISRPTAIPGAAVTIDRANIETTAGRRQRRSKLTLSLRASLGEDFPIRLPSDAEVTRLIHANQEIPIRKEGDAVIISLRPGAQQIILEWRRTADLGFRTRGETLTLPVEAANITTTIRTSSDRWLLTTDGPRMGPAIRFWGILLFAIFAASLLSRMPISPLSFIEWALLSFGLTQIGIEGALVVIAWIFFTHWRGSDSFQRLGRWRYNLLSLALFIHTFIVIGIFIGIAASGLLGGPNMYIRGNGSGFTNLIWYTPRSDGALPSLGFTSISVWWFRFAMLLWALWLASALIRWLQRTWKASAARGHFRRKPSKLPKA